MKKIGFDNEKYLRLQSKHILERIEKFDGKLYLELGGKLFDDYHAARVLPGFLPDSKLKMLLQFHSIFIFQPLHVFPPLLLKHPVQFLIHLISSFCLKKMKLLL